MGNAHSLHSSSPQHSFSLSWFASAGHVLPNVTLHQQRAVVPPSSRVIPCRISVFVQFWNTMLPWLTGSIQKALQDQVCMLPPSPRISGSAQAIVLNILLSSVMFFSGLPGTLRNSAHNICFELSSLSSQVGRRCCFPFSIFNAELLLAFVYWI